MSLRSAIVYLAQNTPTRSNHLRASLRWLFEAFNGRSGHPVLIFHQGDFSVAEQDSIRRALPEGYGTLIQFISLAEEEFREPLWMSPTVVKANRRIVPRARGSRYRTMCRWWLKYLPDYLREFDIYMRLDDDAYLRDAMSDPIKAVADSGVDYASNCIHIEHPLNSLGLSCLSRQTLGNNARLNGLFLPAAVEADQLGELTRFRAGLPKHLRDIIDLDRIEAPIMYYNNFHIARPRIWDQRPWRDWIAAIDASGGQYYLRWGDAPIQTIGMIALGFSLGRLEFRYSKRHERRYDAFVNSSHPAARGFMDVGIDKDKHQAGSMTRFSSFNLMLRDRGIADMARLIRQESVQGNAT